MSDQPNSPDAKINLYYVMWCNPCQTAGVDALECCELEKKEIGWFAAIDPKDMREDGTNNE
jgi:hypothetical protein